MSDPDTGKAADPEKLRGDKERHGRNKSREEQDIAQVLKHPPAKRFLKRLLARSELLNPACFQPAERVQFAAGKRDMGAWMVGQLARVDHDALAHLLMEHEGVE